MCPANQGQYQYCRCSCVCGEACAAAGKSASDVANMQAFSGRGGVSWAGATARAGRAGAACALVVCGVGAAAEAEGAAMVAGWVAMAGGCNR